MMAANPRFLSTVAVLIGLLCNGSAGAADREIRVNQDGLERLAWLVDGRLDTASPAPLIVALHGYRKPEEALTLRAEPARLGWDRLAALARENGFIVVFPAAYRGKWSLVPGLENAKQEDGSPIDDVGFLLSLVAAFVADNLADPERLYLTGISDGAIMTHRLICRNDSPFAAAAALIGTAHEDHIGDCDPSYSPAVMQVHGDNDSVLPYEGWIFRSGREVSVAEVMDHWRRRHGCTGQKGERLEDIDPDDGSTVLKLEWTGCARDPNVLLFKVKGGGHSVPALDAPVRDDPKRKINRDLDTMAEVWRFVSQVKRSGP
ncbi:MAG: PHB depolymerase family esterase [Thalassobaculaceae bacterium]|nr:PHB depolymerase family esterase [Thalassobaculaceae bacterium]